jgi:hypothetical protein
VGWDEAEWHPGSFLNVLKASRYFLAPLAPSRIVLYYYYYYYILRVFTACVTPVNAWYLNYCNVFIGLR